MGVMDATLIKTLVNATHVPFGFLTTLNVLGSLWPPQANVKDGDMFDFVIVGSGAGSVLANRITEDESCSVLIIEAGDNPSIESMMLTLSLNGNTVIEWQHLMNAYIILPQKPVDLNHWFYYIMGRGLSLALQNSYQDYSYRSEIEEAANSQQNGIFIFSAGKSLGGSSNINGLVFLRGTSHDFDSWAEYLNDSSWKYKNVLPYYIKSETMQDEEILNSEYAKYHGTKGPMKIIKERREKSKKYLKSFAETGTPEVIELNGKESIGFTETLLMTGDGVRQHNAQAYLRYIRSRKNLFVLRKSVVLKINIKNKVARSVKVDTGDDNIITIKARKEIIISAGVFNSPKLLLLSGIGPRKHLKDLNIPVIADLPVGQNLQDHVACSFVHRMNKSNDTSFRPKLIKLDFPLILGGVTLDKTKNYPDYQVSSIVYPYCSSCLFVTCSIAFGYKDAICNRFFEETKGRDIMYSAVVLLHPESRGSVKLKSSDPKDDLIIYENFYKVKSDIDNMVKYIKDFLRVGKTSFFKSVNAKLVNLNLEECKNKKYGSTEYLRCYLKYVSASFNHRSSTCAMGSVVDSQGRVYGIKKLRVVDASIMPNITRANPQATVVMIAEKISDDIKAEYKLCKSNK